MRAKLLDDPSGLREKPVRIHISGLNEWRDYDRYPPGPPAMQSWHIQPGGALAQAAPPAAEPDRYRYDPADPTPNIGGNMFAFTGAGPVDNALRENRGDVLCYTSGPLAEDLTIIGQTQVTLHAGTSLQHADFFLRLCDLDEDGISINICDGLIRVTPQTPTEPDGTWRLNFTLHAAALGTSDQVVGVIHTTPNPGPANTKPPVFSASRAPGPSEARTTSSAPASRSACASFSAPGPVDSSNAFIIKPIIPHDD